jgi:hypothetical protein
MQAVLSYFGLGCNCAELARLKQQKDFDDLSEECLSFQTNCIDATLTRTASPSIDELIGLQTRGQDLVRRIDEASPHDTTTPDQIQRKYWFDQIKLILNQDLESIREAIKNVGERQTLISESSSRSSGRPTGPRTIPAGDDSELD